MDSHLSASQDPSASSLLGGRSNLPRSRSGCVHLESSRKACAPRCWMCCWMVWGILKRTWYLKNTNQLLLSLYMMIMENCGLDVSWWTPKTNDIKIRTFETWRISTKYKALGSLGSHLCQTHQPHKLIDLRSPMGLRANFFRWTHLCTNLNQRIDLGAYISTSIYQRYHYMVLWCKFLTKLASGCQFPVNLLPFPKKGSFLA